MADLPITSDDGATPIVINDPTTVANVANVKGASTASMVGDNSLVVALSPNSPLPTGTNNIGVTGVAQGSTTSGEHGDLIQGAATTAAPTYTTGTTNPLSLDTSGNLRVTSTSDSDKNITGTITALNGNVVINTQGMASLVFTLTGTWVATIGFQGFDGTNWITASGLTIPAGGITEALASNGSVLLNCGGFSQVRLIATAFTSGTVNVFMNAGAGTSLVEIYNDSQNPLITLSKDQTGTGSLTAAGQTVVANTNGCSSVSFSLTGTYVATLITEATIDGTNWFQTNTGDVDFSSGSLTVVTIGCGSFLEVRVRASAYTSGTVAVTWEASIGVNIVEPVQLSASNLQAEVSGSVTTDPPTYTTATVQPLSLSTLGSLRTEQFLTSANVYGVGTGAFTPPATPTDVATIIGSATRTVYVTRIEISTTQTTAGVNTWFIIKRSAANTGGTSATPTLVPLDSNNPAVTAVVRSYTANPTALGAAVGTLRTTRVLSDATATAFQSTYTFDFTNGGLCSGVVLRGVAQTLALNFNGAALPAALNVTVNFEWIEI